MPTNNQSLYNQVQHIFQELAGRETAVTIRAPGQVNLLGAHLADSEGEAISAAIEPAVWLAAAPTTDNRVTIHALNLGETAAFQLPHLELFASSVGGNWINYPMGVAWALQKAGQSLVGMDVVLISDLPLAAGLGSSAAVTMAFLLAWEALAGFQLDSQSRAKIGQQAEQAYVGATGSTMPPLTCLASQANQLLYLDGRTTANKPYPVPPNVSLLLVDSGVRRPAPNRATECAEATAVLQAHLPHIQTLRDVSLDELELYGHHLPESLRRRAIHVVGECARVQAGVAALREGNLATVGRLMRQSHISSRDNYETSTPELDLIATTAWTTSGCYGARFAGDGFGGFMLVLVEGTAVPHLIDTINQAFMAEYGRTPPSRVTQFTSGASPISVSDVL